MVGVLFPANHEPTLPLNPLKDALDYPASFVPTQPTTVLRLCLGVATFIQLRTTKCQYAA